MRSNSAPWFFLMFISSLFAVDMTQLQASYPYNPYPPSSPSPSYWSSYGPNSSREQIELTRRGRPNGGPFSARRAFESLENNSSFQNDPGIDRKESQRMSAIWSTIMDPDVNRNNFRDRAESNFRNIQLVDEDFYTREEERNAEEQRHLKKKAEMEAAKRKEEMEFRARFSTRNYFQSQGREVKGVIVVSEGYTGYTGLQVNSYHREYLAILKTVYLAKLLQSMIQYAPFIQGNGSIEEGTFLSMSPHDAVRRINEISAELRRLRESNPNDPKIKDLEEELEKLTTVSGMMPTEGAALEQFNQQRAQIITGLRTQAERIRDTQKTFEDAKEQLEDADDDEKAAATTRFQQAQAAYLQAANSNGLLLTQIEIGDFKGPLWKWLVENPDADATDAFTKAVEQYLENVQEQISQMAGKTDVKELINFFGSPVMAPLRQEVGAMEQMNEYFPGLKSGMVSIEGMWDTLRADEKFEMAFNDTLFAINGGVVAIGAILVPVAAPVLFKLSLAYSATEVGVVTGRYIDATEAQSQMESTANLGVGSNVGGVQYYDQWVTSQGWSLALSIGFAGLDLSALKGLKNADDAIAGAASGTRQVPPSNWDDLFPAGSNLRRQADEAKEGIENIDEGLALAKTGDAASPARALNSDIPVPGQLWRGADGKTYQILRQIGEGEYSLVFELAGEHTGKVLKISKISEGVDAARAAEKVTEAREMAGLLLDAGIPHVKVLDSLANPNGTSYLITELLPDGAQVIKNGIGNDFGAIRRQLVDAGKWTADHERAIMELYDGFAKKGLIWADGHLENLYFFKDANGVLRAGVLDHDMIARAGGELSESIRERIFQAALGGGRGAMAGDRGLAEFSDNVANLGAYEIMGLMMFGKGLLKFDHGKILSLAIDPAVLREYDNFLPVFKNDLIDEAGGLLDFTVPRAGRQSESLFPTLPNVTPGAKSGAGNAGSAANSGNNGPEQFDWDGSNTDFSWSSLTDDTPLDASEIDNMFRDGVIGDSNNSTVPDDAIFADGFESGDTSAWTSGR